MPEFCFCINATLEFLNYFKKQALIKFKMSITDDYDSWYPEDMLSARKARSLRPTLGKTHRNLFDYNYVSNHHHNWHSYFRQVSRCDGQIGEV